MKLSREFSRDRDHAITFREGGEGVGWVSIIYPLFTFDDFNLLCKADMCELV